MVLALCAVLAAVPGSSAAFTARVVNTTSTVAANKYFTCRAAVSDVASFAYPFNEALPDNGTTAFDSTTNGTYQTTTAHSVLDPCVRDTGGSTTFDGSSNFVSTGSPALSGPMVFSTEVWFRTSVRWPRTTPPGGSRPTLLDGACVPPAGANLARGPPPMAESSPMAVLTAPTIPGISGWRPLARGGFATVWEARQESLDRLVAVKVDTRTLDTEAERSRFLAEAQTAGGLSGHPGIVTVHDAGILDDGRPYLVMELCSGGSLTRWQDPENRQSEARVRAVGVRIADALAAAHTQGMLHRDVKPANILIDGYGNAGLADFGLAGRVGANIGQGVTPAYAPPELLRGEAVAEAGDVYQLAATLYAVLGGKPPHGTVDPDAPLEEFLDRLDEPVAPIPGVSPELMQTVLDALDGDPARRPSAAELRDRLTPTGSTVSRRRRLGVLVAVVAVLAVLAVLVGGSGVYLYEVDRSVTANISRGLQLTPDTKRPTKDPRAVDTLNYLLIGRDEGEKANPERNDAIMLVHLNEAHDQAYVISFPRDLLLSDPEGQVTTLGSTYDGGGNVSKVVSAVESLTQTPVDHVATIDFAGFVGLTEELGGVTVDNRKQFQSHGHTYPVGRIVLSGEAALAYVRQGTSDDQDRAEHQRDMLKAILTKGLSPEMMARPQQLTRFLGNAAKRIQVDSSLSDSELRSTAVSLRLRPSNIQLLSAPTEKATRTEGQTVEPVDEAQMRELGNDLRTDQMTAYTKKYPNG